MPRPLLASLIAFIVFAWCASASSRDTSFDKPWAPPESSTWGPRTCPYLAYYARVAAPPGRADWLATLERVGCDAAWELPTRGPDESEDSHLERIALTAGPTRLLAPDAWALLDEAGDAGLLAILRASERQAEHGVALGSLPESLPQVLLRDDLVAHAVLGALASPDPIERETGVRLARRVRRASSSVPKIVAALVPLRATLREHIVGSVCGNADLDERPRVSRLVLLRERHAWPPLVGPAPAALTRLAEDEDLFALLRSDDVEAARMGVMLVARRPSRRSLEALANAAGDERIAPVVFAVLESCSATRDVRASLIPLLGKTVGRHRLEVATALARSGDLAGVDALVAQSCMGDDLASAAATSLEALVGPKPAEQDWSTWWSSQRAGFDVGLHHARRLVELARIDVSDEPMSAGIPSAAVIAQACTQECIPLLERAAATASEQGRPLVEELLTSHGDRWREGGPCAWTVQGEAVRTTLREGTLDEVAAVLEDDPSLPPSLVRAALRRIADDGWEAESVLVANQDAVGCDELDLFLEALDAEDVEDLGSDFLELREGLRCD